MAFLDMFKKKRISDRAQAYLPSGDEPSSPVEGHEPIYKATVEPVDAEFREIPPGDKTTGANFEPTPPRPSTKDTPEEAKRKTDLWKAWKARQAAREGENLERERVKAEIAKQKNESLKYKKAKHEYNQDRVKDFAAIGKKVATLGGINMTKKDRNELYFGKAKQDLYTPSVPELKLGGLRPTNVPKLDKLRQAVTPKPISSPRADQLPIGRTQMGGPSRLAQVQTSGSSRLSQVQLHSADRLIQAQSHGVDSKMAAAPKYDFLRNYAMPKGLSKIEQLVFATVSNSPGKDSVHDVVDRMAIAGISRKQTTSAIAKLATRGHLAKDKDGLEVVR
jgi:hypothetical protein